MSTIKRIGDWNLIARELKYQSKRIDKAIDKGFKKIAMVGEGIVLEHIQNQDLDWVALSQGYRDKKIRDGYSEDIYVKTGSMFREIKGWHDDRKVYVGIPDGVVNTDGNQLDVIASALEYGSHKDNRPARPLFEPSSKETESKATIIMNQVLKETLGI